MARRTDELTTTGDGLELGRRLWDRHAAFARRKPLAEPWLGGGLPLLADLARRWSWSVVGPRVGEGLVYFAAGHRGPGARFPGGAPEVRRAVTAVRAARSPAVGPFGRAPGVLPPPAAGVVARPGSARVRPARKAVASRLPGPASEPSEKQPEQGGGAAAKARAASSEPRPESVGAGGGAGLGVEVLRRHSAMAGRPSAVRAGTEAARAGTEAARAGTEPSAAEVPAVGRRTGDPSAPSSPSREPAEGSAAVQEPGGDRRVVAASRPEGRPLGDLPLLRRLATAMPVSRNVGPSAVIVAARRALARPEHLGLKPQATNLRPSGTMSRRDAVALSEGILPSGPMSRRDAGAPSEDRPSGTVRRLETGSPPLSVPEGRGVQSAAPQRGAGYLGLKPQTTDLRPSGPVSRRDAVAPSEGISGPVRRGDAVAPSEGISGISGPVSRRDAVAPSEDRPSGTVRRLETGSPPLSVPEGRGLVAWGFNPRPHVQSAAPRRGAGDLGLKPRATDLRPSGTMRRRDAVAPSGDRPSGAVSRRDAGAPGEVGPSARILRQVADGPAGGGKRPYSATPRDTGNQMLPAPHMDGMDANGLDGRDQRQVHYVHQVHVVHPRAFGWKDKPEYRHSKPQAEDGLSRPLIGAKLIPGVKPVARTTDSGGKPPLSFQATDVSLTLATRSLLAQRAMFPLSSVQARHGPSGSHRSPVTAAATAQPARLRTLASPAPEPADAITRASEAAWAPPPAAPTFPPLPLARRAPAEARIDRRTSEPLAAAATSAPAATVSAAPLPAPAASPAGAAGEGGASAQGAPTGGDDLERLTDRVYHMLMERLRIERESLGL